MARKAKAVPETPFMNVKDAARVTDLDRCSPCRDRIYRLRNNLQRG